MLEGVPDQRIVYHVICMPINIAHRRHPWPIDGRVAVLKCVGQPAGGFRNNFEGAGHGIDGLPVVEIDLLYPL